MDGKISNKVVVDCSHGNSGKIYSNQPIVVDSLMSQYDNGENVVAGVMIESNLVEGNQKLRNLSDLVYGKSITDACVGLESTTKMLEKMANSWAKKHKRRRTETTFSNWT